MNREMVIHMSGGYVLVLVVCFAFLFATADKSQNSAASIPRVEPDYFMQLDGQTPVGRVLVFPGEEPPNGPGDLWVCMEPDCAEGCNSKPPNLFGNGLLYEESLQSEDK